MTENWISRALAMSAIEKLQSFSIAIDTLRHARKESITELIQLWYADDNAMVRQKIDDAVVAQRTPAVSEIVRQGLREGVFTTAYPDQAGEIALRVLQGMANTHARFMLALVRGEDERSHIDGIVATHAAYMDALERVLGAPANSPRRTDAAAVKTWVAAARVGGPCTEGQTGPKRASRSAGQ